MAELRVIRVRDRYTFLISEWERGEPEPLWGLETYPTQEEAQQAGEQLVWRLTRFDVVESNQLH